MTLFLPLGDEGIVTCNGCFDGLHPGHLFYLGFCRAQGKRLVVGINTDDYIVRHKRPVPIPQDQRRSDLMSLGLIEEVEIFPEENPIEFLVRRRPLIHCIGEEYKGVAVELLVCKRLGIKVVYVPRIGKWSSTEIRGEK